MHAPSRPLVLLLAAVLACAPAPGEARRHGHGHRHHGWMHARFAAVRGWFRHVADGGRSGDRPATRRSRTAPDRRAAEEAALAARRRNEVEAYLRDHPVFATAE